MSKNCKLLNEKGSALLTALIMLLLLTLIGFAAITTSSIEVQISGNQRMANTAFYAAEAAIESIRTELNNCLPENNNGQITLQFNSSAASPRYSIYSGISNYPNRGDLGMGDRYKAETETITVVRGNDGQYNPPMYVFVVEGYEGLATKRIDVGMAPPERCVPKSEGGIKEYDGGNA